MGSSEPARPGAASSSHSPGPEPTTRVPSGSRAARPNGTPSEAATSPSTGARNCILVSGVQSVRVSAPVARRPLTSHPALTTTGGAGAMGLRATGVLARGGTPLSRGTPPDSDGPEPPDAAPAIAGTALTREAGPPGLSTLDTHPPPVRIDVCVLRGDPRLDQP